MSEKTLEQLKAELQALKDKEKDIERRQQENERELIKNIMSLSEWNYKKICKCGGSIEFSLKEVNEFLKDYENNKGYKYKNIDIEEYYKMKEDLENKKRKIERIKEIREKNKLKNYKELKGKSYEYQIGKMYKEQGYKVFYRGINKGNKDGGIDLIAHKDNETLLIQCKNWENSQIKQEHLRIFLGDCSVFLEKENRLKNRKIRKIFITSCKDMEYSVKKYIEYNNVEYLIIDWNNPLHSPLT